MGRQPQDESLSETSVRELNFLGRKLLFPREEFETFHVRKK